MAPDLSGYFDYAATTPVREEVWQAVRQAERDCFANSSSPHGFGKYARDRFEEARAEVAALLGAERALFTASGTEANNLAILGAAGRPGQVLVSSVEHKAALKPAMVRASRDKRDFFTLAVSASGHLELHDLRQKLEKPTFLVSVMHSNNEVGALQPLKEVAALARQAGALVHTDAVQSVGKLPIHLGDLGVDLLSFSAHKFYGPKGIGALLIRGGADLQPVLFGGGHQDGLRPGTEDTPRAIGVAVALRLALAEMRGEAARVSCLRSRLEETLTRIPGVSVLGASTPRLPNISSLEVRGVSAQALIDRLSAEGFAVSSGSACATGEPAPSPVLLALGLSPLRAKTVVRLSLGHGTDRAGIERLIACMRAQIASLRELSPAWP